MRGQLCGAVSCVLRFLVTTQGQQRGDLRQRFMPGEIIVKFRNATTSTQRDNDSRRAWRRSDPTVQRGWSAPRPASRRARASMPRSPNSAGCPTCAGTAQLHSPGLHGRRLRTISFMSWASSGRPTNRAPRRSGRAYTTGRSQRGHRESRHGRRLRAPRPRRNMWRNPGEIAGNGLDDDNNGYVDDIFGIDTVNGDSDPMDDQGHGTHDAGIMAASATTASASSA